MNKQLREKLGRNARSKILEIGNRVNNMQVMIDIFTQLKA
jgi:uncharacterized FAD-dependent dehydrogenase